MGFSTEVKAVLGIDSSKMPEDARKVVEAFKTAAKQLENEGAKAGESTGEKFAHGLGHKLTNTRHLAGALAVALGLSLEKIAEGIATAITHGSQEGWKNAGEAADKFGEALDKMFESHMNPKRLADNLVKELGRAERELADLPAKFAEDRKIKLRDFLSPSLVLKKALDDPHALNDEELQKQQDAQAKVAAIQTRINEEQKQSKMEIARLDEEIASVQDKKGTLAEKEASVKEHIKKLQLDYVNGEYTELELKKKQLEIAQKENELAAIHKEQAQHDFELQKKTLEVEEKRAELVHQRRTLEKDEAKLTDRGKLTVGELSVLRSNPDDETARQRRRDEEDRARAFGSFGENANLSSDAIAAKEKAIQVKRLEEDAEAARLRGDAVGAQEALANAGVMRDALVKSGFTKSTEGDPARELREQIAKDNEQIIKTLNEIATTEKGKYVNQ